MFVSKEDLSGEKMVLLGEIWLSLGHEELQKSMISVRAMDKKTAQAGLDSGKISSFPLNALPKPYFNFLVSTTILFSPLHHRMK